MKNIKSDEHVVKAAIWAANTKCEIWSTNCLSNCDLYVASSFDEIPWLLLKTGREIHLIKKSKSFSKFKQLKYNN